MNPVQVMDIEGFGKSYVRTSFQNNMFEIYFGGPLRRSLPESHNNAKNVMHIDFGIDGWCCRGVWYAEGESGMRTQSSASMNMITDASDAIMDNDYLRGKIESWKKDAIKRLEKSVPRLKKEYEYSRDRLVILKGISFKDNPNGN